MHSKVMAVLGLAGCLLSGCGSKDDPRPNTVVSHAPISVRVSEAGGADYLLTDAYVEDALYDGKTNRLNISGKLASGKTLTLAFGRLPTSSAPANNTDQLDATLGGVAGTSTSGTSVYSPPNKLVDGAFTATFAGVGVVTGSFAAVKTP